jgi:hypothetical protein
MRLFDIRRGLLFGEPLRVAVIGTCRVMDPFEDLVASGKATRLTGVNAAVNTVGEARQLLRWTLGLTEIPTAFSPMVFDQPTVPQRTAAFARALNSADVLLVEISDNKQVRCGAYFLQLTYFFRQFVSRYGAALSPWYRVFSSGGVVSGELIDSTLASLSTLPENEYLQVEDIVRNARLEAWNEEQISTELAAIESPPGCPLGVVTHFLVPDSKGSGMEDRRSAIKSIGGATALNGIQLLNPSFLIRRHGRSVALEKDGKDVYHYAPAFRPTVLDALLEFSRLCINARIAFSEKVNDVSGMAMHHADQTAELAEQLNSMLGEFCAERYQALGLEKSGLYDHYKLLMDRREIVNRRTLEIANFVLMDIQEYDSYHILRAGLGELAFLLATEGLNVVAHEPNAYRRNAVSDFAAYLYRHPLRQTDGIVEVGNGVDVPEATSNKASLCIATFLPSTINPTDEAAGKIALSSYAGLIFDPRSLFRKRETCDEIDDLLEEITQLGGYTVVKEYSALNLVYCSRTPRSSCGSALNNAKTCE